MFVERVESGRGDGGPEGVVVWVRVVAEDTGLRAVSFSEPGNGRWRLRIEDAVALGCWYSAGVDVGSGGGGDGGGECWYVVLVLYVVQLKRLVGPLSLPALDPGVFSIDFLGTLVFAGVEGCCGTPAFESTCSPAFLVNGSSFLGVRGLGLGIGGSLYWLRCVIGEASDRLDWLCGVTGDAILLAGEFIPTLSGAMGLIGDSSCVSHSSSSSATGADSAGVVPGW